MKPKNEHIVAVFCLATLSVVLFRNAWICDDAYITFRTVDNFASGFGLRWNVADRVQTYTHPLWMCLVTIVHFLTGEFYFSVITLSIVLTLASAALLFFGLKNGHISVCLAALVLMFSKAFVDYSTSGLENPLSFLLVALFLTVYFSSEKMSQKGLFRLSLLTALCMLNRMDSFLLLLPPLVYSARGLPIKKAIRTAAMGFIPFFAWELFSLFYYGFLFPNTAYTKLGTGIPMIALLEQGYYYFANSLDWDPITLFVILSGLVGSFIRRDLKESAFALGLALYLLYVWRIGGDFMSGRFLALPLFGAVALIGRFTSQVTSQGWVVLIIVGIIGYSSELNPVTSNAGYQYRLRENGIADERGYYFQMTGLLNQERSNLGIRLDPYVMQADVERAAAEEKNGSNRQHVARAPNSGGFGFYCGPKVHVVDSYALVDPLMARLPAYYEANWRIGHFRRTVPPGYLETLSFGVNIISDKDLAAFYDKLSIIIRGDLLSGDRLVEILKMNLGYYDHLLGGESYRFPDSIRVGINEINTPRAAGTPLKDLQNREVPRSGMGIDLGRVVHGGRLEVSLNQNAAYEIIFSKDGITVDKHKLFPIRGGDPAGLVVQIIEVPEDAVEDGYDQLYFLPLTGVKDQRIGHVKVLD
jgi:arabinofuranosyltransferase